MKRQFLDYSLYCLLLHALVVTSSFGLNDNGEKNTKYDNCLTWRDDRHELVLTCRVANILLPVTFFHNESNTTVYCNIHGDKKSCTPTEENIAIYKYDFTVTIVLAEKKQEKNLNGKWYCIQGTSTQSTYVSLSKGINRDSWVMLRGKRSIGDNGSSFINLECSSCRKPKNLYVEFIIDNVTEASVWENENGDCRKNHESCSILGTCNCLQTGNMFSVNFKLEHPILSTNFSCYMQFSDSFRRGVFSTTASKVYEGKDFQTIARKTVVIVHNRLISDYTTRFITTLNPDVNEQTRTGSTTQNMPTDTGGEDRLPPELIAMIVILFLAVIALFTIRYCFFRKNKTKDKELNAESGSSPLLERYTNMCKICCQRRPGTNAEYACFDCRQFFCGDCTKTYHDINNETKHHKLVDIKTIPEHFSITVFNCPLDNHENSLLQYICHDHDDLLCEHCKSQKHLSCKVEIISEMITEKIHEVTIDHQHNLDDAEAFILSYKNSVQRSVNFYERKTRSVLHHIKCSDETRFQICEDSCQKTMTKYETINHLSKMETHVQSVADNKNLFLEDLEKGVKKHLTELEFVLKFGGNLHVFISIVRSGKTLNDIISGLRDNKRQYRCIDITLVNGNSIILKEVSLSEYFLRRSQKSSLDSIDQMETDTKSMVSTSSGELFRPTAAISPTVNVKPGVIYQETKLPAVHY